MENDNHPRVVDSTPIFSELVFERVMPKNTPDMAFQSYELLDDSGEDRKIQRAAFLANKTRNPKVKYPKIEEASLSQRQTSLDVYSSLAEKLDDKIAAEAVVSSAGYRVMEMEWLRQIKRLNDLAAIDSTSDEFLECAKLCQDLNEALYGKPELKVAGQVYGEIMAQIDNKELDDKALKIKEELYEGTTIIVNSQEVRIPGIYGKAEGRLAAILKSDTDPLEEILEEKTGFIWGIVDSYVADVLSQRGLPEGETPSFDESDMKILFEKVRDYMDPNEKAGISVEIVEGSGVLAWDSQTMTVKIGANRGPTEGVSNMVAKIRHELYTHGIRAINGLKSELPILGTGIYTRDEVSGDLQDYLTFEEGLATVVEMITNKEDMTWTNVYVSKYLASMSFHEGADFRQAFEINWRTRALMVLESGEALTDKIIEKERTQAYLSVFRLKRSSPMELDEGAPLMTFNKDLSYLEGKLKVIEYLRIVGDNKEALKQLFTAKFDPTDARQKYLVDRYGV